MRERPILMSAPMIRAILAGTKTQTRRAVKPQPRHGAMVPMSELARRAPRWNDGWTDERYCPYGERGEKLWVRETWNQFPSWEGYFYAADDHSFGIGEADDSDHIEPQDIRWRPSIHMPRTASRITLEITGVRVERLQDISEQDALAEGVVPEATDEAVNAFRMLWESINGPGSWEANPFVWVVEFRRADK